MPSPVAKRTGELTPDERTQLRAMLDEAYEGDFADTDWDNALGGTHLLLYEAEQIVCHASVVPRQLVTGGRTFRTGFVEAVATRPSHERRGLGTEIMQAATAVVREHYELGSLCTGSQAFYERTGWERWQGETFVRKDDAWLRTPEEDDAVMILRTDASRDIDVHAGISCEWRPGDVW